MNDSNPPITYQVVESNGKLVMDPAWNAPDPDADHRGSDLNELSVAHLHIASLQGTDEEGRPLLPPIMQEMGFEEGDEITPADILEAYIEAVRPAVDVLREATQEMIEAMQPAFQQMHQAVQNAAVDLNQAGPDQQAPNPREQKLPDTIIEGREQRESQRDHHRRQAGDEQW